MLFKTRISTQVSRLSCHGALEMSGISQRAIPAESVNSCFRNQDKRSSILVSMPLKCRTYNKEPSRIKVIISAFWRQDRCSSILVLHQDPSLKISDATTSYPGLRGVKIQKLPWFCTRIHPLKYRMQQRAILDYEAWKSRIYPGFVPGFIP